MHVPRIDVVLLHSTRTTVLVLRTGISLLPVGNDVASPALGRGARNQRGRVGVRG